jgi:hypothetical protein
MIRARTSRPAVTTRSSTLTVAVPLRFARRGGRKTVISPAPHAPPPPKFDNALIKAIARAHRWRRMIECGEYATITELAKGEKVNQSYACRLLRLTLLAPDLVERALDGSQSPLTDMGALMTAFPTVWVEQRKMLGI